MPGLAICIPTTGRRVELDWAVDTLACQVYPPRTNIVLLREGRGDAAEARELLVEEALRQKCKFVWFVDDDTAPPRDAAIKMMHLLNQEEAKGSNVKAVTGVYCTKQAPSSPLLFEKNGTGAFWNWKKGDIFPIWGTGGGCLMVLADAFEKLPRPWFKIINRVVSETETESVGEDLFFCDRLADAGMVLMAHGGVICDHYDSGYNPDGSERKLKWNLPEGSYPLLPREGAKVGAGMDVKVVQP
jgi:hypothetical protein